MNITDPILQRRKLSAREHLESLLWPEGPLCPHCGNADPERIHKNGRAKARARASIKCRECEKPFSVTVGTVFESSHVPLNKWLYATHKLNSGKKGTSAHQLHRELGVSYKTAWFMAHRIREAMPPVTPHGGEGKIIEADETVVGGKGKNRRYAPGSKKATVLSLVERGGGVRSTRIASVSPKSLRPAIVKVASRKSRLMTDDAVWYTRIGEEFASHESTEHAKGEYVRGDVHTNTVEGFFSILKCGIIGTYHHVSEEHLPHYLAEFDFRYNHRAKLGVNDGERAARAIAGAKGKRLTYRQPHRKETAN